MSQPREDGDLETGSEPAMRPVVMVYINEEGETEVDYDDEIVSDHEALGMLRAAFRVQDDFVFGEPADDDDDDD